jgi:hypothetical protein
MQAITTTDAGGGHTTFSKSTIQSLAIQTATPTTGQTVTITNTTNVMVINPAGTLVALTLSFPTGSYDGQSLVVIFSQAVTTVTLAGASLITTFSTAALGLTKYLTWSSALTKWC